MFAENVMFAQAVPQYQNAAHPEHLKSFLESEERTWQWSHRRPFSEEISALMRAGVFRRVAPAERAALALAWVRAVACGRKSILSRVYCMIEVFVLEVVERGKSYSRQTWRIPRLCGVGNDVKL